MKKFKLLLKLFLTFFKIGAFTFGGGYAMIALFEHEFVEKKNWIDKDEFYDVVAIAESTPGPIAINSATYIGYKVAGILGSTFATIGICLPSLIIIYLISLFFDAFLSLTLVQCAFKGIQVCVCYLILSAGLKMAKKELKNPLAIILFSVTLIAFITLSLLAVKFSSIFYILIGAGVSVVVKLIISACKKVKKGDNS